MTAPKTGVASMNLEDFITVENAYQPSERGSWAAYGRMLLTGGGVAVGCGVLFAFFKWFITTLLTLVLPSDYAPPLLIFSAVMLGAVVAGEPIGIRVSAAARAEKNRNRSAAKVIGFLAGGVGAVTYLSLAEALRRLIPFPASNLEALCACLVLLWMATRGSSQMIAAQPFCEVDQEFMDKKHLGQYPFAEALRVRQLLRARQFETLRKQAATAPLAIDQVDRVEINFWYCSCCRQQGFINGSLYQTRYYALSGPESIDSYVATRLIYSAELTPAEIAALTRHL